MSKWKRYPEDTTTTCPEYGIWVAKDGDWMVPFSCQGSYIWCLTQNLLYPGMILAFDEFWDWVKEKEAAYFWPDLKCI